MSNPTITGDSSNVNITNANLVVTNDIHANAFFDSSGTIVGSGGGATPTLQAVTDTGSSTTTTVTLGGGLVTSNVLNEVFPTAGTLTLDMDNVSYKTFTANVGSDITTLTVQNHIPGSQGMVYLTANADVTIQGFTSGLGGTGVTVGFDDIELLDTNTAVLTFTSDGTNIFTNAAKYPAGDVQASLQDITDNGSTTTSAITMKEITVNTEKGASTESSGTLTVEQNSTSYQISNVVLSSNITALTWSNVVTGSQHACTVEASGDLTISNSLGADVKTSFSNVSVTSGNTAVMYMFYDGLKTYVNCIGYN